MKYIVESNFKKTIIFGCRKTRCCVNYYYTNGTCTSKYNSSSFFLIISLMLKKYLTEIYVCKSQKATTV